MRPPCTAGAGAAVCRWTISPIHIRAVSPVPPTQTRHLPASRWISAPSAPSVSPASLTITSASVAPGGYGCSINHWISRNLIPAQSRSGPASCRSAPGTGVNSSGVVISTRRQRKLTVLGPMPFSRRHGACAMCAWIWRTLIIPPVICKRDAPFWHQHGRRA